MVGTRNAGAKDYRKRTTFGTAKNKKTDPIKELDENLLALDEVDWQSCWRIYRLEEDYCEQHVAPQQIKFRNCKQNPYCISRLGLEKFDKLQQSLKTDANAETLVRRNPNVQPCGLANYGNFCYVNSFLQIWFNDLRFRQCIYDWRPSPDWVKPANAKLDIQEVMDCLQRLFLTLQFTPFETTDAQKFIQLLRLDNEQQDVQEFHTLFFDMIERNLEMHPNGEPIRTAIRYLFQSLINHNTVCACGYQNPTDNEYRSLPISIDGFSSLLTAIEHFFTPEGLNDYKCSSCEQIGETTKILGYAQLPQVLIIQLNRYVYDSSNKRNKKIKTPITYPRILKATQLKQDATYNDEYELCAAMIHEGPNSHCGHYYDIIRDPLTKNWFTYNDRQVQMEKRAPGYEGFKEPKENARATNDQKGCYALIYQRKPHNEGDGKMGPAPPEAQLRLPPEELVNEVRNKLEDNFTRESKEGNRSKNLWEYCITHRHTYLNDLVRELEVHEGRLLYQNPETIVFVPTSLLTDLFKKEYEAVKEMHSLEQIDIDYQKSHQHEMFSPMKVNNNRNQKENEHQEQEGTSGNLLMNFIDGQVKEKHDDGNGLLVHRPLTKNDSIFSFDGMENGNQSDQGTQEKPTATDTNIDYSAFEYLYAASQVSSVHFVLCKHGKVPLDAVIKGDLKAVRTEGAQRLVNDFDIHWFVHQWDEQWERSSSDEGISSNVSSSPPVTARDDFPSADQPSTSGTGTVAAAILNGNIDEMPDGLAAVERMEISSNGEVKMGKAKAQQQQPMPGTSSSNCQDNRVRTAEDICPECVKFCRSAADFRSNLKETEKMLADITKNMPKRTYDPNRANPEPSLEPHEGAVWVSHDHFKRFGKIAQAQQEKAGRLSMGEGVEEPSEKRQKGDCEDVEEAEDMAAVIEYPPSNTNNDNDDIQVLHERINTTPTNSQERVTLRKRRHSGSNASFLSADGIDEEDKGHEVFDANGLEVALVEEQNGAVAGHSLTGTDENMAGTTTGADGQQRVPRFNEDLYCKHGSLACKTKRVWLSRADWDAMARSLLHYFDPVPCTELECVECREEINILNEVRDSSINQLQVLLNVIKPMLNKFFTRKWENAELGTTYQFVLCREYVTKMRNINNRSRQKQVVDIPTVCQECLLCNHGRPFLQLPNGNDDLNSGFENGGLISGRRQTDGHSTGIPLMEKEWRELIAAYQQHVPEQAEPVPILLQDNGQYMEFCDDCYIQHNQTEEMKRYIYPEGAMIHIKMKGDESEDQAQASMPSTSASPRPRVMVTRTMTSRQKNYYKIKMRSDETIMDLKVQLMQKTKESPNDHLLYLNDQALDNTLTLEAAHVAANNEDNPLILIVQQRRDSEPENVDSPSGGGKSGTKTRALEKGFRDTALA